MADAAVRSAAYAAVGRAHEMRSLARKGDAPSMVHVIENLSLVELGALAIALANMTVTGDVSVAPERTAAP